MNKRKAMTPEKARQVRSDGHLDAKQFAKLIGLNNDYQNDPQAKKDVIDPSGDAHSVKSGNKRWQIFLYSRNRFINDPAFKSMNGIGQLIVESIDVFPEEYTDYLANKNLYKESLREPMKKLYEKFRERHRIEAFIAKSLFNGNEVNYLTIKHDNIFHVFLNKDVTSAFSKHIEVVNSKARSLNQKSEQKVLFKYQDKNLGELEIRNSSGVHYKEVLFVMNKLRVLQLLFDKIPQTKKFSNDVLIYGSANKKFGNWLKK